MRHPDIEWLVPSLSPVCASPHFVLFFNSEASAHKRVYGYVRSALRDGLPALVIGKPALLEHIRDSLHSERAADARYGPDGGTLVLMDAQRTLDSLCVAGKPDPLLFEHVVGSALRNLASNGRAVAAYGEMVGVLCERGRYEDAIALERLWNSLLEEVDASLVCGYTRSLFAPAAAKPFYEAIRAAHTSAYDESTGFVPSWT